MESNCGGVIAGDAWTKVDSQRDGIYSSKFPITKGLCDAAGFLRGALLKYEEVSRYRRLLMAIASDNLLGSTGVPVQDPRRAIKLVRSELLGACIILMQYFQELENLPFEPVWRVYVDEAITRARLACAVANSSAAVGKAEGILACTASFCGVALQIATGSEDQKERLIRKVAQGGEVLSAAKAIYQSAPRGEFHLLLREWRLDESLSRINLESQEMLDLQSLVDALRADRSESIPPQALERLGLQNRLEHLLQTAKMAIRESYSWRWMFL